MSSVAHKIKILTRTIESYSVKPYKDRQGKIDIPRLMVDLARLIASKAFELDNVRRSYSKIPYMTHPEQCLIILKAYDYTANRYDHFHHSALLLHDTLEDTFVTKELLTSLFLMKIKEESPVSKLVGYVDHLTDKEPDDGRDRTIRKNLEADRIALAPPRVIDLKMTDGFHNFSDIMMKDWKFAISYAEEKLYFLSVIPKDELNKELYTDLKAMIDDFVNYRKTSAKVFGDNSEGYMLFKLMHKSPLARSMKMYD